MVRVRGRERGGKGEQEWREGGRDGGDGMEGKGGREGGEGRKGERGREERMWRATQFQS